MISLRTKTKTFFRIAPATFFLVAALLLGARPATLVAAESFPVYPAITKNVAFWEAVYSRYSTRQGILHDSTYLDRVYAVIDLVDWEAPDSGRINGERIKEAKQRINDILTRLGSGSPPVTVEEKRIAALFPRQRHTTFHEARDAVRLQVGQKDRFSAGVIRSGKYLPQFRQIFVDKGLPPELAYLPHVESSFNPKAYSKAGAAGLWQFTRATGKEYMTVNELVDERYDPYLATRAAAQLLKDNYAQLRSWPLALTAYNHGRAGMMRAVREMGSYENIFRSYNQGAFQFASRNFYAEFLAAMRVAKRMAGNPGIPFDRPEATVTFRLHEATPIDRLLHTLRIPRDTFLRLNPALMQPVLDGTHPAPKGTLIRSPAAKQPKVPQVGPLPREATPSTLPPSVSQSRLSAARYTVRKGDTLLSIARRFQLSPQELLAANGKSRGTTVKIGEQLIIPAQKH